MKRILILLMVVIVSLTTLTGCGKEKETVANAKRSDKYKYDYVDFLDIEVFGPNGTGMIQITPKVLNADEFENEDDFIKIKKLMDTLALSYIPGIDNKKTTLVLSKTSELTNGEMIAFGIKTDKEVDLMGLDINLENYEVLIEGLSEGEPIDLFNDDNVVFYNLEGTKELYAHVKSNSEFEEELKNNIVYKIQTKDNNLIAKNTILEVTAGLNDNFIKQDNNYFNLDIYMSKHNYIFKSTTETVLDEIIPEVTFGNNNDILVERAFNSKYQGQKFTIQNREYTIDSIANIQQSTNQKNTHQFSVIFKGIADDNSEVAIKANVKFTIVNSEVEIIDFSSTSLERNEILTTAMNTSTSIIAQYYYSEPTPIEITPEVIE